MVKFFDTIDDFAFIILFIDPTHCCILATPLAMLVDKPIHLK